MSKLFIFSLLVLFGVGLCSKPLSKQNACTACNNFVDFAKQLTSRYSGEEIRDKLVAWCKDSGNGANRATCLYLVNDLLSSLSRFNFDSFCVKVNACPSLAYTETLPETTLQLKDNITCDFCTNTMTHIKGIVASKETEDEFKMLLSGVCNYFSSFRSECINMMDQNLDDIFEYLRNILDPNKFCKEMGYCTAVTKSEPEIAEVLNLYPVNSFGPPKTIDLRDRTIKAMAMPHIPTVSFGPECFVCKKIFTYVYDYISKSEEKTDEVIIEALDKVCAEIFTTGRAKCERIVNESVHQIIYYVKIAAEPDIACSLLGYCLGVQHFQPAIKPNCLLCKEILSWVYNELKDNKTEQSIQDALDRVCEEVMPASKVQACKDFIDAHLQQLIDIIVQETNPDVACQLLGFCTSHTVKTVYPFVKLQKATKVEGFPISGAVCDICRQVFHWINTQVSNPKVKEEVITALDEVCQALPQSKRQECINFVEKYANQIIEVIMNETNPDIACSMMHLCTFKKSVPQVPIRDGLNEMKVSKHSFRNDFCYVCQLTAHFIQEELYNYKNEEEINNFLKNELCNRLVLAVEKEACDSYINEYGAAIEQLIAQKIFDPTMICEHMLRICPKKHSSNPKLAFELLKPNKEKHCKVCMKAVDRLDVVRDEFDYKPYEKNISLIARTACKVLLGSDIEECQKIVETYGISFLKTTDLKDSRRICHLVDICLLNGKVHLLGGNKCTFGPTYWCHTSAHASACKATDYCKHKVWSPMQ